MNTKSVDLKGYRNLSILGFTVRETFSQDTIDAAGRSSAPGEAPDPAMFQYYMRHQTLAGAVTEWVGLDGAKHQVSGWCNDLITSWNARTREFVGEAYDWLNGISSDDREAFRKALGGSRVGAASTPAATSKTP